MWLEKRKDDEAGSVSGFSNIFCVEKQQNNILGPLNFCMIACFLDHCRITFLAKKICNVKGHHFEFYWHRWPKQNFPTIFSILEILITWPALISYFQWYSLLASWSFWKKSVLSYVSAWQSLVHPSKAFCLGVMHSACWAPRRRMNCLQSPGSQAVFLLVLV